MKAIKWTIKYFELVEFNWDNIKWWWYCLRTGNYKD